MSTQISPQKIDYIKNKYNVLDDTKKSNVLCNTLELFNCKEMFSESAFIKKYYSLSDTNTKNILGKTNRFINFFSSDKKIAEELKKRSLVLLYTYLGKPELDKAQDIINPSKNMAEETAIPIDILQQIIDKVTKDKQIDYMTLSQDYREIIQVIIKIQKGTIPTDGKKLNFSNLIGCCDITNNQKENDNTDCRSQYLFDFFGTGVSNANQKLSKNNIIEINGCKSQITGSDIITQVNKCLDNLYQLNTQNKIKSNEVITLQGFSRGCIAAMITAQKIKDDYPDLKINLILDDPCKGPNFVRFFSDKYIKKMYQKANTIPLNVINLAIIYKTETGVSILPSSVFDPTIPTLESLGTNVDVSIVHYPHVWDVGHPFDTYSCDKEYFLNKYHKIPNHDFETIIQQPEKLLEDMFLQLEKRTWPLGFNEDNVEIASTQKRQWLTSHSKFQIKTVRSFRTQLLNLYENFKATIIKLDHKESSIYLPPQDNAKSVKWKYAVKQLIIGIDKIKKEFNNNKGVQAKCETIIFNLAVAMGKKIDLNEKHKNIIRSSLLELKNDKSLKTRSPIWLNQFTRIKQFLKSQIVNSEEILKLLDNIDKNDDPASFSELFKSYNIEYKEDEDKYNNLLKNPSKLNISLVATIAADCSNATLLTLIECLTDSKSNSIDDDLNAIIKHSKPEVIVKLLKLITNSTLFNKREHLNKLANILIDKNHQSFNDEEVQLKLLEIWEDFQMANLEDLQMAKYIYITIAKNTSNNQVKLKLLENIKKHNLEELLKEPYRNRSLARIISKKADEDVILKLLELCDIDLLKQPYNGKSLAREISKTSDDKIKLKILEIYKNNILSLHDDEFDATTLAMRLAYKSSDEVKLKLLEMHRIYPKLLNLEYFNTKLNKNTSLASIIRGFYRADSSSKKPNITRT